MKSHLIVFVLLLSSIIPMSAQTRLGTIPWDRYWYRSAADSLLLEDDYINGSVILESPWASSLTCLKCHFDLYPNKCELRYLVYDRKSRDITTYRCPVSEDIFDEVSVLIESAVYSSVPDNYGIGIDAPWIEFYWYEHSAMCDWPPKQDGDNCDRLVSLISKLMHAVQDNDLESIEKLRPEIKSLAEIFNELRAALEN